MLVCIIVWRIFGYSNIFEYFLPRIFVRIIFVSFFWYEYIRIFVRIIFLIRIYSDIRSYHIFHIIECWIFGYSNIFEYFPPRIFVRIIFVSFFWYEYIRTFVRIVFFNTNIFGYSFVSKFHIRHTMVYPQSTVRWPNFGLSSKKNFKISDPRCNH